MKMSFKNNLDFLIFLFCTACLVSCSKVPIIKDTDLGNIFDEKLNPDSIVSKALPKWFQADKKFSLEQMYDEQTVHMFYDMTPDIDYSKSKINFVAVTPQGSEFQYQLDMVSGQHFVTKTYCAQEDIWKSYKDTVYKPPFTLGVVPRILDQLGTEQKIIVFGGEDRISKDFLTNVFDARIIGGFLEQTCPQGGCFNLSEWQSRVVLVGVLNGDSKFENIQNLNELQQKVDWELVRAFLHNGQGQNKLASTYYPAYRVGALFDAKKALEFIDKNSVYLKNEKLLKIRNSCHLLYEKIWKEVGQDSEFEKNIIKLENTAEREMYLSKHKLTKSSLFYHRFKTYFKTQSDNYKTCLKYIYPSNINDDSERHWFFAYYSAVHLLHELNYSFSCSREIWVKKPLLSGHKRDTTLDKEFVGCNAKKIDTAIEQAIMMLDLLAEKNLTTYRYIDYDNGSFGTHNKVYSWVHVDNKQFQCKKILKPLVSSKFQSFPKDVKWRKRRLMLTTKGALIK